ncbi:MAG TPA: PEP-CTERM sorting domain-containing protein [Kiritimatiellia bacterium]|nr:PEP-CTERM sorting domain-containing protein [Kiritimatiellia bacterium]
MMRACQWNAGVLRAAVACGCLAVVAEASILYHEDFSDVSDWLVIYNDQGGAASITSDGNLGTFYVESMNNFVAFAPNPALSGFASFDPSKSSYQYYLFYEVASLTDSTSYSIEIDQFDSSQNYLSTVFSVAPQSTFVGSNRVLLADLPWNPSAAYILPKVTVYTGLGDQTVVFDSMGLDLVVIPEPSVLILLVLGAVILRHHRRSIDSGRGMTAGGAGRKDAEP